jgi:alkanesulfonate monooxygenase SsuD/methylene tetrahydromethanopterin reductase-like flavin-dependent oxidoreductase (luciferase family)
MGPTVTCPVLRYRPEVVAQTFASLSHASSGQIFLGLGSGEALNEQAVNALNDLFKSGVTIVNVHSGQADQHAAIDFYGSRVLPQLHSASVS